MCRVLQAGADVVGESLLTKAAQTAWQWPPELGVYSIEDDPHLVMKQQGQTVALPAGGTVTQIAVFQVKKEHGVAGAGAEAVQLGTGEIGPKVHVGVSRPVEVLEVVDSRTGVQLAQEQGESRSRNGRPPGRGGCRAGL
jgi:hypothetical protein